jgi:CHAT domain
LSIPFEAACAAAGRIPSLTPGVFIWRRPARTQPAAAQVPSPGPLKILVAVGAPDEGKTQNTVLDMERELQTVLDAVENARMLGNAYVRILEIGSVEQIGAALRELSYHVLHLSGHGNQGIFELEDEDGNPEPTTAPQLAAQIRESGHPPTLVVLASCHSGRGDQESTGFAQGLLSGGVPAVLAMQTAVTDFYATALASSMKNWPGPKSRWPVGRPREVREIIRVFTNDPKSIEKIGRKASCQILGAGGVGK